jgi:hypothetical protein
LASDAKDRATAFLTEHLKPHSERA